MADNNEDELVDYDEEEVREKGVGVDSNCKPMMTEDREARMQTPMQTKCSPILFPICIWKWNVQEVAVGDKAVVGDEAKETKKWV